MILDNYSYDNYIAYGQSLTMIMSDDFTIPDDKAYKFASWGINAYSWADHLFLSLIHILFSRVYLGNLWNKQ